MLRPRQIRDAVRALEEANSYAQWLHAAHDYDAVTGGDAWRDADPEDSVQAVAMRQSAARLALLRTSGDADGLVEALTEAVFRHLGEIRADEHYSGALAGPRRLLVDLQDEIEASLLHLARNPPAHIPRAGVLARFRRSQRVFGRSALLLSGGATWGFHHLGVVKALFEQASAAPHHLRRQHRRDDRCGRVLSHRRGAQADVRRHRGHAPGRLAPRGSATGMALRRMAGSRASARGAQAQLRQLGPSPRPKRAPAAS